MFTEIGMAVKRPLVIAAFSAAVPQIKSHIAKMALVSDKQLHEYWIKEVVTKYLATNRNLILKPSNRKLPVSTYSNMLSHAAWDDAEYLARSDLARKNTGQAIAHSISEDAILEMDRCCHAIALWVSGPPEPKDGAAGAYRIMRQLSTYLLALPGA